MTVYLERHNAKSQHVWILFLFFKDILWYVLFLWAKKIPETHCFLIVFNEKEQQNATS